MLVDGRFWIGVGAGVLGVWAFHRYVRPMASTKTT